MTLYNNVNTSGVNFTLEAGIYTFKLGAIQTVDQCDLLSIAGVGNWEWSTDGVNFNTPLFLNNNQGLGSNNRGLGGNNTYYADELLTGLTLIVKVLQTTDFTIRTDDTFIYPYDDAPTNPVIDLEVLHQNSFSVIPDDSIGNVIGNVISTENAIAPPVSVGILENSFFRTALPHGIEGSGALFTTDPSPNLVSVNWQEDNGIVLFFDGQSAIALNLTQGDNQLLLNPVSDEWGFIVIDKFNSHDTNILTINSIELVNSSFTESAINIYSLGDVNNIDLLGNTFEIATGTGDRSVSTIGKNLAGDKTFLSSLGTEGSYFELTGLNNGVYSFDIDTLGKIDLNNNDALYVYNGENLTLVFDNQNGIITNQVDVIYGELSFIALDSTTKTGTTEFTISNINKQSDLSYIPPQRIDLIPDNYLGDIDFYPSQTRVSNGGGDRAVSTIGNDLRGDRFYLSSLGTEGSYATWSGLQNGVYEITYSLYASENDVDRDDIYFYDGNQLTLFDSRSSATIQSSATRWISGTKTAQVDVTNGELTFITLDTVDKSGTTQLRISNIKKLPNQNDPYSYIYSEPPYPIPNLGKDLPNDFLTALDLGILKPWETDTNTGTEYNQGYIYGSYHLGASYINEAIGAGDAEDWIKFSLDEQSYINLLTPSNATTELLDSNLNVIGSSPENNNNSIQNYLQTGDYFLRFSTASGLETAFGASLYLSNSDPNYAD